MPRNMTRIVPPAQHEEQLRFFFCLSPECGANFIFLTFLVRSNPSDSLNNGITFLCCTLFCWRSKKIPRRRMKKELWVLPPNLAPLVAWSERPPLIISCQHQSSLVGSYAASLLGKMGRILWRHQKSRSETKRFHEAATFEKKMGTPTFHQI